ncbi:hypothetical protein T01_15721 [Trichinella spiralis]|uniref:Uncharacterized protein n=1 Tax=Trichinella spiralis TaxID=6334 RepID=A0A0V0YR68_TRISP|nr:hypothetical protein T01_15721 [Trichinella spiralis]
MPESTTVRLRLSPVVFNYGRSGTVRSTAMKRIMRRWDHQRNVFAII